MRIINAIVMMVIGLSIMLPTFAATNSAYYCPPQITCSVTNQNLNCSSAAPTNWIASLTIWSSNVTYTEPNTTFQFTNAQSFPAGGLCNYIYTDSNKNWAVVSLSSYAFLADPRVSGNVWIYDGNGTGKASYYCYNQAVNDPNIHDPNACPFIAKL